MKRGEHSNKLPPEHWMSLGEHQMPLVNHPGNSVGCASRDNTGQANFYAHGVSDSRFREDVHVPRTSMIQPCGLLSQASHTSRPVISNSGSQTGTDRSAWAHFLSLDPSLADYNSQNSNQHQTRPYGRQQHRMGNFDRPVSDHNSMGHHLDLVSESLSLPSMNNPLSQPTAPYNTTVSIDSFQERSVPTPSHHAAPEHINQLINLSRNAGNFSSIPTSASSQPVESLDRGGYSPVSPPTHDIAETPPTSFSAGSRHVAEILTKDVPSSANFNLTSENNFGFMSNRQPEPFMKNPTSRQSITTGLSSSFHNPQTLSSPIDMPLDMTSSKEEGQNLSVFRKNDYLEAPASGNAAVDILKINSESKTDYLLGENAEESIKTLPKPSLDTISNLQLSADRQPKPVVRSTPKKSNFYGRDASLFSFSAESLSHSDPSFVSNSPKQPSSDVLSENTSSVLSSSIACAPLSDNIIDTPQSSLSLFEDASSAQVNLASDCDSSASNFADSFIDASTRDCEPCNTVSENINPYSLPSQDSAKTSDGIGASQPSIQLPDMDGLITEEDRCLSVIVDASSNGKSADPGADVVLPNPATVGNENSMPSSQCDLTNLESNLAEPAQPDDFLTTLDPAVMVEKPGAKRKRRKASGFPTRQRKRGKKGLEVSLPKINSNPVLDMAVEGAAETFMAKTPKVTKRRRKAVEETKGDDDADEAPRRSSSRKSKATAMRLIELQADSSYGYTSNAVNEESPPPPPVKTKKRATRAKKVAAVEPKDKDGGLSGDSLSSLEATEDEQDKEYAPDEEDEFQADLSPTEESKEKFGKSRKVGGLKISIKLGTENLAQIVSGTRGRPTSKKRKAPLKRMRKTRVKSQAIIDEDEDDEDVNKADAEEDKNTLGQDAPSQSESSSTSAPVPQNKDEKLASDDSKKSLLDKYFDAAMAVNKQMNTEKSKKVVQVKKRPGRPPATSKLAKTKSKGIAQKVQKPAKKLASKLESEAEANDKVVESNSDEVPKFVCGYCPKRYHNKDELMAHMEAHMAEMESKGDNDSAKEEKKPVSNAGSKKIKLLGIQEKPESKATPSLNKAEKKDVPPPEHKCGECGLVFPSKTSLLDHVSTHTVDKPFECNLCHKCFKERDLLSAHRKTHNQEGLVRCPICSKGFIHEPDLVRHIETHPKRSTPLIPLKRKRIPSPPQKTVVKAPKTSTPRQGTEQPPTKPTSFASALSGIEGPVNKTMKNPTIVLKRGEVSAALSSLDSSSKASKTTSSPSLNQKLTKQSETGDITKTHSSVARPENKESVGKTGDKADINKTPTTTDSDPGHCTCKECPECVTRFLQSFY